MKCKIAAMAGAIIGWGGAILLTFAGQHGAAHIIMAQAGLLAVGMMGTAWLMLCAYRRPMAETFAYAYQLGRSDERKALGDPDGGGRVVPLRRTSAMAQHPSSRTVDAV